MSGTYKNHIEALIEECLSKAIEPLCKWLEDNKGVKVEAEEIAFIFDLPKTNSKPARGQSTPQPLTSTVAYGKRTGHGKKSTTRQCKNILLRKGIQCTKSASAGSDYCSGCKNKKYVSGSGKSSTKEKQESKAEESEQVVVNEFMIGDEVYYIYKTTETSGVILRMTSEDDFQPHGFIEDTADQDSFRELTEDEETQWGSMFKQ